MKIILRRWIALCLLSFIYCVHSFALDYYWIGKGVNNNWSLPGNWATTSGATVSNVQVPPTLTDNAIFDANSFTTANKTVTIDVASTCDSIIFRNIQADRIPTLTVNAGLTVKGSMTLVTGMTVNGAAYQTIQFQSIRPNETLATAGVTDIAPSLNFTGTANWTTDGSLSLNRDFTFSSSGSLTVNGGMTAYDITLSGGADKQFLGNITISHSFTKTDAGNVDIFGYLETVNMHTINNSDFNSIINFSGSGNMTVGSYVSTDSFAFSGDGNLTVNGYLSTSSYTASSSVLGQSAYLGGTGTKTIKGYLTAYMGIIADGGTVNIQGDLIMNLYSNLNWAPTSISGGCKMTIAGNIINNGDAVTGGGRFSVSDAGTEVEVKGGYVTLYDLYIVNGGKLLGLTETVQCNGGWYTYGTGNIPFTSATAPKLIRIGKGDLIANATDVYNDVEFFGTPADSNITNANYHTINQGTYNSVAFMNGSGKISTTAGITTNSLIIYPQAEYGFSNTTTVNNYLEMKPRPCGGMIQVTGGTIAMGAGSTVVAENLLLQNNTITGATSYTAINSGDRGGNTGWNFSEIPNTYYWVGGSGLWNDINHWANATGGTSGSGCIPTLFDNVVFDDASGLNSTETITVPDSIYAYCNNMTWNGITGTPVLNLGISIARLYIGGSLELNAGMKITNPGGTYSPWNDNRGIHFVSNRNIPYETITTNGVAITGNVRFYSGEITSGGAGGWVFQDNWTGTAYIWFQQGSLNFNGKAVTAYFFSSDNSLTRALNIANSTATMTYYWVYTGTGSNIMTDIQTSNSQIKASYSTVKIDDKYNNVELTSGYNTNGIFNKIILSGTNTEPHLLNGTIVTDSLILAANLGATYILYADITVNKYLQSPQDCGLMSYLTGNGVKTITMGAAGILGENVKMKNMKITNVNITDGPIPTGGYLADDCELGLGTETGWNVVSSAGTKRYYWVGGTGNWSDISHWSDESGGTGGAFCNPPRSVNTVVFDANSFKANNCVVTIDAPATCDSMLWIGTVSETPTLNMGADLTVSGSMLLQQNMEVSCVTWPLTITFNSTRPKESLKTNGVSFANTPSITFNVTGEWDIPNGMSSDATITFDGPSGSTPKWISGGALMARGIVFNRGTLDLSGQTVDVTYSFIYYTTVQDSVQELIMKDATININWDGYWSYNGILTAANSLNSVINFNRSGTMTTAANQVYNDVNITGTLDGTSTINAPAGTNTTQFRKVTFANPGTTNNGNYQYLYFKNNGTINTIEADTLRFNNNDNYTYTFGSGATSTINKKWYGSGLPCFRITLQSSVDGMPAYVNVGKAATTIHDPQDALFLDYIYANGIIANQGPDLALLEKGFGSPDNETLNGRTYNAMTLAEGWIMDTYDPRLSPLPDQTLTCGTFPYVIDPVQYVTTPESTYEWRKGDENGTLLNPGNPNQSTWTITDASEIGAYYLKVDYHPEGTTCVLEGTSVVSAIAVDSLIWTGAVNKDWNNAQNWNLPDGAGVSSYAPTACTNVLIPARLTVYPDLSATDYTQPSYETAACNNIYIEHGGEVVRTDLLEYTKANVQITLEANRWNMISAPLRDMYPGDFYQTNPCPHADSLRIYQQLFAIDNPETGQKDTNPAGSWTKPFNNPEIAMPAGFGYAIQLIDEGKLLDGRAVSNEPWTPLPAGQRHSIWLPKNDTFYYIYAIRSSDGQFTASCNDTIGKYMVERNFPYRFIYEGGNGFGTGSWTGDVTLTTGGATDANKQVIVGNPFMSHWSFDDFYAQDSTLITNDYKVLEKEDDATFTTYSTRISSASDMLIAPMQSILVTSKTAFGATDLKTRVTAMAQNPGPGALLKRATVNSDLLKIVAAKDGKQNQTYILFDASASNNYLLGEDSYKLFVTDVTEPVAVYTRSADGYALDINLWGDCSQMIPLGIRTSQTGTISLQFEGAENFNSAFLFDNQTGEKVDLQTTPAYSFEKTTSDLFLDGRFSLLISKATTGIFSPVQGMISIFTSGGQLKVTSGNAAIEEVQVFDMQGRLLQKATNIGSPIYTYELGNSGMYIVKASDGQEMTVKKAVNP